MQTTEVVRPVHAHHTIAAAIFVASLILGAALVLSAELMKTERYEFHPSTEAGKYIVYDRETGRAASPGFGDRNPLDATKD